MQAQHKKDCDGCSRSFHRGMEYVLETFPPLMETSSPWFGRELCVPCFGERLRNAVGTDRAEIDAKLASPLDIASGFLQQFMLANS